MERMQWSDQIKRVKVFGLPRVEGSSCDNNEEGPCKIKVVRDYDRKGCLSRKRDMDQSEAPMRCWLACLTKAGRSRVEI